MTTATPAPASSTAPTPPKAASEHPDALSPEVPSPEAAPSVASGTPAPTSPPEYRNTYFHGDFVGQWVHNFIFDHDDRPQEIRFFQPAAGRVVCITQHPKDGALYYISYNYQGFSQLRRISYAGTQPPKASIALSQQFGPGPLSITFDGSASFDPEQQQLAFFWEFGDGSTSTLPSPTHLYLVDQADGPRRFDVRLTVTDPAGLSDTAESFVTVNNTPPKIEILSPVDGSFYPSHEPSTVQLLASIADAEHDTSLLKCRWDILPHHNDHTHPNPPIDACSGVATIAPEPCNAQDEFWYEFILAVQDPLGLTSEAHVHMQTWCCPADFTSDGFVDFFDFDTFVDCFEGLACPPGKSADFDLDGFADLFDFDAFVTAFEQGC